MVKFKQRRKLRNILTIGHKDALKDLNTITMRTGSLASTRKTRAKDLGHTAFKFGIIGLTDAQTGNDFDYFTVSRDIRTLATPQWLNHTSLREDSYRTIVSPFIITTEGDAIEDWEYSPSYPCLRAKVRRWETIHVKYLNIEEEIINDKITGFTARVFQQMIDQCGGLNIMSPFISHGNVEVVPGTQPFWGEEICESVEHYSKSVKRILQDAQRKRLFSFDMRSSDTINDQLSSKNIKWGETPKGQARNLEDFKDRLKGDRQEAPKDP